MRFALPILIGAGAGAAYHAAYVATNEWYPVEKLNPKPEAFHMDRASFDIFAKLSRFQKANPRAYRSALLRTDSLLALERALTDEEKPIKPMIEDGIRAETYAHVASKNAHEFLASITKPEEVIEATRHVADLNRFLEIHVSAIQNLCKQCT